MLWIIAYDVSYVDFETIDHTIIASVVISLLLYSCLVLWGISQPLVAYIMFLNKHYINSSWYGYFPAFFVD